MARRAAAEVQKAIHHAVLDKLARLGYAGVTFEGIARQACTSKPVLYRRYNSRSEMVLDALLSTLRTEQWPKPTGRLREDLLNILQIALGRARVLGADTYRSLLAEMTPASMNSLGEILGLSETLIEQIVNAAVCSGELAQNTFPPLVLRIPFTILREQFIFGLQESLDLEQIVDQVCLPLFQTVSLRPGCCAETEPGLRL